MIDLAIKATRVFEENYKLLLDDSTNIIINEGGARSSKTYSILQNIIIHVLEGRFSNGVSIVRKELSALKSTAMKDFFEILNDLDLYDPALHNKSDYTYTLNGTLIEFIGMDKAQKKRGAKRDLLFLNEANELTWDDFLQLNMRTSGKVIMDYNPSMVEHWIYSKVEPRKDSKIIKSTYLDAYQFLSQRNISEIEFLIETDKRYWKVYGLGERAVLGNQIFQKLYRFTDEEEKAWDGIYDIYGLDFGFNHPTVLVAVKMTEKEIYIKELIHQTGLNNRDLIDLLPECLAHTDEIIADSQDPARIDEIQGEGFNIVPAIKGKGSVYAGIDLMLRHKLYIHEDSYLTYSNFSKYSWKEDSSGNKIDEPVKYKDDACDAARYPIFYNAVRYGNKVLPGIYKWSEI